MLTRCVRSLGDAQHHGESLRPQPCLPILHPSGRFRSSWNVMMAVLISYSGIFVPMQTCFTLLVNMLTGLLVWEDWRVVRAWGAYVSVHMIMILAIYLLAPSDFVQMYRNRKLRLALNVDPDALEAKLRGEGRRDDAHVTL